MIWRGGFAGILALTGVAAMAEDGFAGVAGDWQVTEIAGSAVPETAEVTLVIDAGGRIGGTGGCNAYGGQITAGPGLAVSIGEVIRTMMFCQETMEIEDSYLRALEGADQMGVAADGRLVLMAGGRVAVLARPVPAP